MALKRIRLTLAVASAISVCAAAPIGAKRSQALDLPRRRHERYYTIVQAVVSDPNRANLLWSMGILPSNFNSSSAIKASPTKASSSIALSVAHTTIRAKRVATSTEWATQAARTPFLLRGAKKAHSGRKYEIRRPARNTWSLGVHMSAMEFSNLEARTIPIR